MSCGLCWTGGYCGVVVYWMCLSLSAGIINVLVTTPLWVVNTRLKLQGANFRNEDIRPTSYSGILGKLVLSWPTVLFSMSWCISSSWLVICVRGDIMIPHSKLVVISICKQNSHTQTMQFIFIFWFSGSKNYLEVVILLHHFGIV